MKIERFVTNKSTNGNISEVIGSGQNVSERDLTSLWFITASYSPAEESPSLYAEILPKMDMFIC